MDEFAICSNVIPLVTGVRSGRVIELSVYFLFLRSR